MADEEEYHIYQVPRPTRSQSLTDHPTPPLPIRVPVRQKDRTVYTQNQVYAVQLPIIPSSAPPTLPPRNQFPVRDHDSPPQQQELGSSASGSSTKKWRTNPIPHFGSFKEKSKRSVAAVLGQAKRQFSDDTEVSSYMSMIPDSRPQSGSRVTLGGLAESYPHSFPFQVRAMQSYIFQASQLTITNTEVYNLLLIKQQQFVSMQDRLGISYPIPLNSAVQFGYINSSDRRSSAHALAYKSYTKVADLLSLSDREMPRIVCAQETHRGQNVKCSVEENEVLLILQIRKVKLTGKKYLKVYSFNTKSKKSLHQDCVGHFTTNPAHLRLWLTDMVGVHASIFPCQAVIYLEKRFTSSLKSFPPTLLQADSFVTLTELKMQKSIVASLVSSQASPQSTLLDMPLNGPLSNLQVEVQTPPENESLHAAARMAYEALDISSLQSLDDGITDRSYSTKCLFYSILRKGSEQVGVHLLVPSSAYLHNKVPECVVSSNGTRNPTDLDQDSDSDNERYEKISDWVEQHCSSVTGHDTPSVTSASSSFSSGFHSLYPHDRATATPHMSPILDPKSSSGDSDEDYEVIDSPTRLAEPVQYSNLPTADEECFDFDGSDLQRTVRLLEDRIVPLERKVAEHQQLQALVRALSARIAKLEKQLMPYSQSSTAPNSRSATMRPTNIAHLRALDPSQVMEVLDALNLSQYKPTFHYMGVSGERLSQYTDILLESHLGITQRSHRERLMQLINGSMSVQELL